MDYEELSNVMQEIKEWKASLKIPQLGYVTTKVNFPPTRHMMEQTYCSTMFRSCHHTSRSVYKHKKYIISILDCTLLDQ